MPLGSATHIDFQLRHAGELVVYGTQKGYGLLDTPGQDAFDQTEFRFRGYARVLVVREGAFDGLTQETNITVAGTTYTVRDIGSAGADGLRRLIVTLGAVPDMAASITVQPSTEALFSGQTVQLTAVARNAVGTILPNKTFRWASSDSAVATVDTNGLVTAIGLGSATITATVDGVSGAMSLAGLGAGALYNSAVYGAAIYL